MKNTKKPAPKKPATRYPAPKKPAPKTKKAERRIAGDAAEKIAAKYLKLCGRAGGATMADFFKATPDLSADQVRHRIVVMKRTGTIEMRGPRARAAYWTA